MGGFSPANDQWRQVDGDFMQGPCVHTVLNGRMLMLYWHGFTETMRASVDLDVEQEVGSATLVDF